MKQFEKKAFTGVMEFVDDVYNKETFHLLAENFMEDYAEDVYAKMSIDRLLFDGHYKIQSTIQNFTQRKKYCDLVASFNFIGIESVEDETITDKNKKRFRATFTIEGIPFNKETMGLMFGEEIKWEDLNHEHFKESSFVADDWNMFLAWAIAKQLGQGGIAEQIINKTTFS